MQNTQYRRRCDRLGIECTPVSTITNIVNFSLISGQFHPTLKESVISPLLKKPTLDKVELSNYRPISKGTQPVPKPRLHIAVVILIKTTASGEIRTWVLSHRSRTR